jgi:hypothetical protein
MAGRTPAEAVQNYLDPLLKAISCVTDSVLSVRGGYHPSPDPHPLALANGDSVIISSSPHISLSVLQHYRIVEYEGPHGPWKVTIVSYYYALEDAEGHEILYHWHPQGRSTVTFPHLHVRAGGQLGSTRIDKSHFPTGRVALEDVLRLAIRDFGVRPQRDDWAEVLDRTQTAYEEWRTWA